MSEGNKTLPFGILAMVRAGMRRLDLYGFLDRLKSKGVPLSFVVELMCVYQLDGGNSMNECGNLSDSVLIREELCHGYNISRKTIERSLEFLDLYFEEILGHLWTRLNGLYPIGRTDVYVDGSHIPRHGGAKGAYTAAGEGGGSIQIQDHFMVAQLVDPPIPVSIEVYRGNLNDPPQYADFIPQLMCILKEGSTIIVDQGGSAKSLLDEIRDNGMEYITRVKMNASDLKTIREDIESAEYVGRNTMCIRHDFETNHKTNYLYFSVDRYILGCLAAERKASKLAEELAKAKDVVRNPKVEKLVTVKKNPFYKVKVTSCEVTMTLNPWLEEDIVKAMNESKDETCGWFKLQSSKRLDSNTVLDIYRHRVGIEHLISSLKSVVNLRPLRVWSKASTRGSMLLALIAQTIVSMVRNDMEPDIIEKWDDGRRVVVEHKPSIDTICKNLAHWTVVLIPVDGYRVERVFANENELTRRISAVFKRF